MSKIKLLVEIDENKYRHITEMPNVYASEVCEVIRNGTPYNPTGEHSLLPLAGEADNAYMRGYEVGKAEGIMKASTRPQGEQIAWEQGYEAGLAQGKAETRPQGEYISVDKLFAKCSICGNLTRVLKKYNMPNFCPACGADMRKGEKK